MEELIARHTYNAQNSDELSFKRKDRLWLLSRLNDKGWWKCRDADGLVGLVPANFLKSAQGEGGGGVVISKTEPEPSSFVSSFSSSSSSAAAAPPPPPPTAAAAATTAESLTWSALEGEVGGGPLSGPPEKSPSNAKKADPFDLEAWAAEMENLLLSDSPVVVTAPISGGAEKKPETKQSKQGKEIVEEEKKTVVVAESSAETVATPVSSSLAPASPRRISTTTNGPRNDTANGEWIEWMERAIAAEKHLEELMRAAEDDRIRWQDKLAESDKRAMRFEEQVAQMIEDIQTERDQINAKHRAELAVLQAAAVVRKGGDAETEALQTEVLQLRREKAELQQSIETDIFQLTRLLEEEQTKHCEAVEKATRFHELYEDAREIVHQLEDSLQEKSEEIAALKHESASALATEQAHRRELESKLAVAAAAASGGVTQQRFDEMENELMKERHQRQILTQEVVFLKQQVARLEKQKSRQRDSVRAVVDALPGAGAPPPTMTREAPLKLQSAPSSEAVAVTKAHEANKKISEVSAELARQRMLRAQEQEKESTRDSKVSSLIRDVKRASMDFSSADSNSGPTGGTSGAGDATSPQPVSRSRAQEILMRARALAAKTKAETEGGAK